MEKLLTAEDTAELLNTRIERVWALARDKDLPCVKLGKRQVRFARQAVEQFITAGGSTDEKNGKEK
jgi:excisionase family DNA binding protein